MWKNLVQGHSLFPARASELGWILTVSSTPSPCLRSLLPSSLDQQLVCVASMHSCHANTELVSCPGPWSPGIESTTTNTKPWLCSSKASYAYLSAGCVGARIGLLRELHSPSLPRATGVGIQMLGHVQALPGHHSGPCLCRVPKMLNAFRVHESRPAKFGPWPLQW